MTCENCGEREAVIHLTQIVDNVVTTTHLCETCAAERGIDTGANVAKHPLGDFLASLGKEALPTGLDIPCSFCGATLQDFRETGRLGCDRCYASFQAHLRDLLRRLHGSAVHVGERYTGGPVAEPAPGAVAAPDADGLREQLRLAVEAEDFERAAELRDRIRSIE